MDKIISKNVGLDISKADLKDNLQKVCLSGNYAFAPNSQGVSLTETKKFVTGSLLDANAPAGVESTDGFIRKWRVRQPTPDQMVDCY